MADGPLLYCVTGSIAATMAPQILQMFLERHLFPSIRVALSRRAARFVSVEALAVLSKQPCILDLFADASQGRATHIELARKASAGLVAPASANTIAKLAGGIADDTITTLLSVFPAPIIVVPAIHPETARKPAFIRNIEQLRADGVLVCGPVHGYSMSEGKRGLGLGAMPGPDVIAAFVEHVVLTGVPPDVEFERLDPSKRAVSTSGGDRPL